MSLRDYGLSDNGEMKVQHALTISLSAALEKPFLKAIGSLSEAGKDAAKALKIVGYGVASYLLLLGFSKVIESSRKLLRGSRRDS